MRLDQKYLKNYDAIIGCDEAGRGPLAGPVVACALRLERSSKALLRHLEALGVADSKALGPKRRQEILALLGIQVSALECGRSFALSHKGAQLSFALAKKEPQEIDKLNILQASLVSMREAAKALAPNENDVVLVDGNRAFEFEDCRVEAVVKGDRLLLCIGLASIIAKEFRDEKMRGLGELYPGYGLEKHAGYPTAEHRAAIARLGISPAHRLSFKGVKEYASTEQGS